MNLEKLKPWNWFKHEENGGSEGHSVAVAGGGSNNAQGSRLRLHRDMDRWFDEAMNSFAMPARTFGSQHGAELSKLFRPQIDVAGDSNCYEISLDVPGMDESDLSIDVKDDVLVIKGQKEERSENRDKQYYRVERSYGSFQRVLSLPDDANADEIKANLEKGVLKLEIPRRESIRQDVKSISISS